MTDQEAPEAPKPTIVITFAGPGRADCRIDTEGVEPAQVFGAAMLMDMWARELRAGQVAIAQAAAEAMSTQLVVPNRAMRRHPTQ